MNREINFRIWDIENKEMLKYKNWILNQHFMEEE